MIRHLASQLEKRNSCSIWFFFNDQGVYIIANREDIIVFRLTIESSRIQLSSLFQASEFL